MPRKPLRTVSEDERAAPKSIVAAAAASERSLLGALREKLAREIDSGVPAHALRGIVSELRDVDRTIRVLDARENGDGFTDAAETADEAFDPQAL